VVGYGEHDNETSDYIKTDSLVIMMNLLYFVFAAWHAWGQSLPCILTCSHF
jgi:hypothetical protein